MPGCSALACYSPVQRQFGNMPFPGWIWVPRTAFPGRRSPPRTLTWRGFPSEGVLDGGAACLRCGGNGAAAKPQAKPGEWTPRAVFPGRLSGKVAPGYVSK